MSENELRQLLHEATPTPPHALDRGRVAAAVRRRRRRRTTGAALAVAVVGAGAVVWWPSGTPSPVAVDPVVSASTSSAASGGLVGIPASTSPAPAPQVAPCSTDGDWEPESLQFRGRTMVDNRGTGEGRVLSDLGAEVGQVDCSAFRGLSVQTGTKTRLYSYAGYDPRCVVAVRRALLPEGLVGEVLTFWATDTEGLDCVTQQKAPGTDGYRLAVMTHCGVVDLQVNGQRWRADPPLVHHGNPPPGWGANEAPGLFVVDPSGERATFHTDSGKTAEFRRARPDDEISMCD